LNEAGTPLMTLVCGDHEILSVVRGAFRAPRAADDASREHDERQGLVGFDTSGRVKNRAAPSRTRKSSLGT
jgi:hypothetical protein